MKYTVKSHKDFLVLDKEVQKFNKTIENDTPGSSAYDHVDAIWFEAYRKYGNKKYG